MTRPGKYPPDLRKRAVLAVLDRRPDFASETQAVKVIAEELGIASPATLRSWVRRDSAAKSADVVGFGPRGQRLYDALTAGTPGESVKVLAEESARMADRLDELDRIIAGKGVLRLMQFRVGDVFESDDEKRVRVTVSFDSILGEARQQAGALRQILSALGVDKAVVAAPASGGTPLDELNRKRAEREAARKSRA